MQERLLTIALFAIVSGSVANVLATSYILNGLKVKIILAIPGCIDKIVTKALFCSQCIGFWTGLVLFFFMNINITGTYALDCILSSFLSSYFAMLLNRMVYGTGGSDEDPLEDL
jgi:hypothetical protein